MRIWFDISNSPHINLFKSLILELQDQGHEVRITSRPLANTIDLLKLHGFDFEVVGVHYGKKLGRKIFGYPIRVWQLYSHLRFDRPDVSISHSSFHSPVASRLLGCRCIYLNDNEHALGNIPAFIFASTIMVPEFLSVDRIRKFGGARRKVIQYPGVKEGIYLWNMQVPQRTRSVNHDNGISAPKVYVRPEPWTAQYYSGAANFMDAMLIELSKAAKVVVLPRGVAQAEHYRQARFASLEVQSSVVDLPGIVDECDLFIGAGGTMTREMAVLGVPTISVYQDSLLDVDTYLISIGQMVHNPALDAKFALEFLEKSSKKAPNTELLAKGRDAYNLIKTVLLNELSQSESVTI